MNFSSQSSGLNEASPGIGMNFSSNTSGPNKAGSGIGMNIGLAWNKISSIAESEITMNILHILRNLTFEKALVAMPSNKWFSKNKNYKTR